MRYLKSSVAIQFEVDENAESRYGKEFWMKVISGNYELGQMQSILRTLQLSKPKYFLDIGASSGIYSLLASSLVTVYVFEPDAEQFMALKKNCELNPQLRILPVRAFITGQEILKVSPYSFDSKVNSFESIRTINLIKFLTELNTAVVVKMDIEGIEWQIVASNSFFDIMRRHNSSLFLSPHMGFFWKERDKSHLKKLRYRLGVIREFIKFWKLLRKASGIWVGDIAVKPISFLLSYQRPPGPGFSQPVQIQF